MTRRGGKEASERSREIGEDERQPVMARLAARRRRSNLVILVLLESLLSVAQIFLVTS